MRAKIRYEKQEEGFITYILYLITYSLKKLPITKRSSLRKDDKNQGIPKNDQMYEAGTFG